MKFLMTSSLIIGAVFLLGASTSLNAIDTQSLVKSSHDSNIVKIHGHGGHGHHGHHHGWNRGWDGGWGGWGGGFGGPGYYYGGPGYYVEPGPGICIGSLCVL